MKRFALAIIIFITLSSAARAGEITLAAGAGLKDVLNELTYTFVRNNPAVKITKNYAASGVLAKQLDGGARMDVIFVANRKWMNYMQEKRLVEGGTVKPFAYNTLVFVGRGAPWAGRIDALPTLGRIAVGSPKSVPAGEYALEALRNSGLEKQLEKKLVMARDVRECLMYAERGEVDGAFVYWTDALFSRTATVWFTVPPQLYSRVIYLSALTGTGARDRDAVRYFSFLHSDAARVVLQKYGFEIPATGSGADINKEPGGLRK